MNINKWLSSNELIDAAWNYADKYEGDDRECICSDIFNAFVHGAKFGALVTQQITSEEFRKILENITSQKYD